MKDVKKLPPWQQKAIKRYRALRIESENVTEYSVLITGKACGIADLLKDHNIDPMEYVPSSELSS